jgi:peptide/nickel transport system substrate-binding protein
MRCIALHWRAVIKGLLRVVAVLCVAALPGNAAVRPQYGGVLRVELRAPSANLNPAKWKTGSSDFATNQRLAELVYDRLVTLDNYGTFQPQLATKWTQDAAAKSWQFTLRQGVKFSNGTTLTPGDVVAALQSLLPRGMQVAATSGGIAIQSVAPAGDLLELLASGAYFIYKDIGAGLLKGTGPFVLESVSAGVRDADGANASGASAAMTQRLRFRANENCWSGRPYLDAVEVTLGVPPLKALLDLQLGKADLSELSVETSLRAQQTNLKCWASVPLTLYALRFSGDARAESEQWLREAIGLSVDRGAMARVLLQKQAEVAGSFLPQWLSGYAFLFDTESNLERAKELRKMMAASAPGAEQALRISVDGNSELSKLIAERVVVDARAAGLTLQTVKGSARPAGDGSGSKSEGEAQMIAWRYSSLSPRTALKEISGERRQAVESVVLADADARYAWERKMMDQRNLLPLVTVPDFVAVVARVRNWAPAPWGEWRLADVWLEQGEGANSVRGAAKKAPVGAKP